MWPVLLRRMVGLWTEQTPLERDNLIAEWGRLVGKESQVAQIAPPRPQYEKRGEREAARQLGLDPDDIRRALKVVQRMHYLWGWEYHHYW